MTDNRTLTLETLKEAIDAIKAHYPDSEMLKEIRLLDHRTIKKLVSDAPKEDLPTVWGIPIVTDKEMLADKMKFVYRDGRTETFNV